MGNKKEERKQQEIRGEISKKRRKNNTRKFWSSYDYHFRTPLNAQFLLFEVGQKLSKFLHIENNRNLQKFTESHIKLPAPREPDSSNPLFAAKNSIRNATENGF